MPKITHKTLKHLQTPVKSTLFTKSKDLTHITHIKSYLYQTKKLIKISILSTKSRFKQSKK